MILVDQITEQELDTRFDALPPTLKDALTSERNLNIVSDICGKNKIVDEEKTTAVQQIVALSILGIIHYYDVGKEIGDALSLNSPKFSEALTEELTVKVFSPIKTELENNYRPILNDPTKSLSAVQTPKIIQEAKPVAITSISAPGAAPVSKSVSPAPLPAAPPKPAPVIGAVTSQIAAGLAVGATLVPGSKAPTNPTPSAAKSPSDPGWSKQSSQQPVVKLGTITPAMPTAPARNAPQMQPQNTPAPQGAPTPRPATGALQNPLPPKGMSEFDRLDLAKKGVLPPQPQQPPAIKLKPVTPVPASPLPPMAPSVSASIPRPPQASPMQPSLPQMQTAPTTPTASAAKPPEPPPMMLHQMSNPAPLQKSVDIRLNNSQNQIGMASSNPPPSRPAVIEFGGEKKVAAPPPPPPRPPQSSQPPQTPPSSNNPPGKKVIVQDYR